MSLSGQNGRNHAYLCLVMPNMTLPCETSPPYRTSHDLASALGQSHKTACRVLRELWPNNEGHWRLDQSRWEKTLLHLATCESRRYGKRRNRARKPCEVAQ